MEMKIKAISDSGNETDITLQINAILYYSKWDGTAKQAKEINIDLLNMRIATEISFYHDHVNETITIDAEILNKKENIKLKRDMGLSIVRTENNEIMIGTFGEFEDE